MTWAGTGRGYRRSEGRSGRRASLLGVGQIRRAILGRGRLETSTHDIVVHRSLDRIGDPAAFDKRAKSRDAQQQLSQAHGSIVTCFGGSRHRYAFTVIEVKLPGR